MDQDRSGTETLTFDADGELVVEPRFPGPFRRACPVDVLDGSWLLEIESRNHTILGSKIRGPMRIEVGPSVLRASGDVYTARSLLGPLPDLDPVLEPLPPDDLHPDDPGDTEFRPIGRRPWYPTFPKEQYSWYFRSNGATYAGGTLTVNIVRHLWNRSAQDFVSTDTGTLVLHCRRGIVALPRQPQRMEGTLTIGGSTTAVSATKTSTRYRGCRVEVDAMVNRTFPASATIGSGALATFRSVYASAGWDVTVVPDEIDVPEDTSLTNAELAALLTAHRQAAAANASDSWRLWLLVGSTQGDLFGIMFDDDAVPREGAVGFADAILTDDPRIEAGARNRPLDEVPAAFLRTLVHEAGHALNLFHPKHDVHHPPIGIEIMNQTGDVIGFASAANPYPGNAGFVFAEHDLFSLRHAPDPQVRPGWKNFGWGHGGLSAGLPVPVDVAGLTQAGDEHDLVLTLAAPAQAYVGEYVTAEVTLTNTGAAAREVSANLNLAQGDVVLERTTPDGRLDHVLDVVVGCGPRPLLTLAPGESLTGRFQVFFTNQGVTFDAPGRHSLLARVEVDPLTTVVSGIAVVDVRSPATDAEVEISASTLADGVGRAFALGDFGADGTAAALLTGLAEAHAESDTGAAGALVMANALARRFTDHAGGDTREPAPDEAARFLRLAAESRSAAETVGLAVTVASPTEKDAPVVGDTLTLFRDRRGPAAAGDGRRDAAGDDLAAAERIAAEFTGSRNG